MNTIEEDHSSDRDRLHALIEVWLNGAELTDANKQVLNKALQSQCVVSAMAGMSIYIMRWIVEEHIAFWGNISWYIVITYHSLHYQLI